MSANPQATIAVTPVETVRRAFPPWSDATKVIRWPISVRNGVGE